MDDIKPIENQFFDTVKSIGSSIVKIENYFEKWSKAYNKANNLENKKKKKKKTFLFSAQHKDCIILSTILTKIYNSKNIIWRPNIDDDVTDDGTNQKLSASLSLLDWSVNESANSFLNGSISNTNRRVCKMYLNKLVEKYKLEDIIKDYYDKLQHRYLCLFEFDEQQLKDNVQLTLAWGKTPENPIDNIKIKIKVIKQLYKELGPLGPDYQFEQKLQGRIIPTIPSNENMYISHILEPDDDNTFSEMKAKIIERLNTNQSSYDGGKRRTHKNRKSKKSNKCKKSRKARKSHRKSNRRRGRR